MSVLLQWELSKLAGSWWWVLVFRLLQKLYRRKKFYIYFFLQLFTFCLCVSQCGVSVRAAVAVFLISEEALKVENIQLLHFSHTVSRIFSKYFFCLFIFMTLTSPIRLIDCFERSEEWLWWRSPNCVESSTLLIHFPGWRLPSVWTYISTLSTLMPQAVVASSRIPFNSIICLRLFFRFVFC